MFWRPLYDSCISETNPDKLRKLVSQLEEAIVVRYHDLASEPNAWDELQAIKGAAQRLLRLKAEKLGWSQPAFSASPAGLAAIPSPFEPAPVPLSSLPIGAPVSPRGSRETWQALANRAQAALHTARRAWQAWVFKSPK